MSELNELRNAQPFNYSLNLDFDANETFWKCKVIDTQDGSHIIMSEIGGSALADIVNEAVEMIRADIGEKLAG